MTTVNQAIKDLVDELAALELGGLKYYNLYKEANRIK